MALQLDAVAQLCQQITKQIRENYKALTVHFIIHHDGQRNEALGVTAQEIIHHPAAETAMRLMQQPRLNEESALLGTAAARNNVFMGLAWRDYLLALCTINIDHLNSMKDVRRQAWHLAWHSIDAHNYHDKPDNRSGPAGDIIVRRRSAVEMARANLQADTFSAIMCALQGDRDALKDIGKTRAMNALSTRSAHMPEFYPYAIAMDATEFSFHELGKKLPSRRLMIPVALKIARAIDRSIDKEALINWFSFCEPAQDMAWRGFSKEDILSAAINTSPDTFVRSTGHMMKDMVALEPSSFIDISELYSPYADDAVNEKMHEKLVEHIFEDVIAKGISQHNPDPFIKLANKQNEELSEGRMMGWCAAGLQAAARVLENSHEGDRQTEQLVRREFHDGKSNPGWENLKNLGNRIVQHQRDGEIITLARLSEIAGEDKSSKAIQNSVQNTINDPEYQNKLEYLNTPAPAAPAPRTPAPAVALRMAAPGPRAPGMGGNRTAIAQTVHQPPIRQKTDEKGDQGQQSK
jgi:hypothetical protein